MAMDLISSVFLGWTGVRDMHGWAGSLLNQYHRQIHSLIRNTYSLSGFFATKTKVQIARKILRQ